MASLQIWKAQSIMSADVLQFTPTPKQTDGGKARILRRRDNFKFRLGLSESITRNVDDLMMDHADPGYPSDSPYRAPDSDPA
jgi:hypothetical protein